MKSESDYPPIEDYAIIGDCRCAALISKEGSLDWLCLPRFDSPSFFGALLDAQKGGRFVVRPTAHFTVNRRYIGDTNVLETTFRTETGLLRLTDLMPIYSQEDRRHQLCPERHVLRVVACLEGKVEIEVIYEPRPDYGRVIPQLTDRRALGFFCEHRGQAVVLRSELPLALSPCRSSAHGRTTLQKGERCHLSLAFVKGEPAIIPVLGKDAEAKIAGTVRWWEEWASLCTYEGPYRNSVIRSALALKLMTYSPSGALVAAPTTSLPERIGGVRNWDYRYCWLRDAAMTLRAFFDLGYTIEEEAFLSWMLHSTRLTRPELQVAYDVYGETRLKEQEPNHLRGYAGSRPVRIGNDAGNQLQLDIYGEVADAAFEFVNRDGRLDRSTAGMLRGWGEVVCRRWREPDEGIWEIRSGRRQHTYSKVMCWVALDRLLKLHEAGHIKIPKQRFSRERDALRAEIETHGYSERQQSYVSSFEGEDLDASLLLLPIYGYVQPTDPRMRSTYVRIGERLGKNGLLYRYTSTDDGLPPGEGPFAIGSFWAIQCRALQGEVKAAMADFEHILSFANDVGLFAEEIDAQTGAALGNFPQAFTHIGLINAALTLADCMARQ